VISTAALVVGWLVSSLVCVAVLWWLILGPEERNDQ
jgi:hypothetical protein